MFVRNFLLVPPPPHNFIFHYARSLYNLRCSSRVGVNIIADDGAVTVGIPTREDVIHDQVCQPGGVKSAQCYEGVEGRCRACDVYRYLGIAVRALYSASCAFSFSIFQTWNRPGRVLQIPDSVGRRRSGRVQGTSVGCVRKIRRYISVPPR